MIRAAIYPAFVTFILTVIVTFLLVFVIPTFEDLFNENRVALPWLTQQVIHLSRWMSRASTLSIAPTLVISLTILLWRARGNPRLIRAINNASSRIPIWASLTRAKIVSECSSLLASLTRVGIPILEALTIISETVQNETAKSDLERIRSEIIEGNSLSTAFKKSRHFTGLFANLIEAGENSGQLETMLNKAALLYREELEQTFELLKQLAEPALILAIGVVVGTTVLAIYLPIFQIGDLSGATNLS
jgi:type IV pilus assembly protein PilC